METHPIQRVALAFVKLRTTALIAFSRNVVTQMTALSKQFTDPVPALADVTTSIDKLDVANQAALDGSRQAIRNRNAAQADLLSLMRQLAAYVQNQSQSDISLLASTGFHATRVPVPIGPLLAPRKPNVQQGPTTGTLSARTGKVTGAYAYNWRLALASAPTVYVQTAQTTAARYTFEGLTAGEVYNVQANALGTAGASDWTPAITQRVV